MKLFYRNFFWLFSFGIFLYCFLSFFAFLFIGPFGMARMVGEEVFVSGKVQSGNPVFWQWLIMFVVFKWRSAIYVASALMMTGLCVLVKYCKSWIILTFVFAVLAFVFHFSEAHIDVMFRPRLIIFDPKVIPDALPELPK